ncbi:MAG: TlpA family protein disulfide reductase [Silvanigrellaceae bacterium]
MKHLGWIFTALLLSFVMWKRVPELAKNFAAEGKPFPSSNLQNMDGSFVTFPEANGAPFTVVFWTRTCGPCKLEMERIQDSVANGKISPDRIVAIHIGGTPSEVKTHMDKYGFTFRSALDPDGIAAATLEVNLTPTIFLVSGDRKIAWASSGLGPTDVWRIEQHLKKQEKNTNP